MDPRHAAMGYGLFIGVLAAFGIWGGHNLTAQMIQSCNTLCCPTGQVSPAQFPCPTDCAPYTRCIAVQPKMTLV